MSLDSTKYYLSLKLPTGIISLERPFADTNTARIYQDNHPLFRPFLIVLGQNLPDDVLILPEQESA